MRIALYGLPCSGKTTFMESVSNRIPIIHGSRALRQIAEQRYHADFEYLDDRAKAELRFSLPALLPDPALIDGHYSFLEEGRQNVVMTEADAGYDVYLYLDTPAGILKRRIAISQKNARYSGLTAAQLQRWKEFEIDGLRRTVEKYGHSLYLIQTPPGEQSAADMINRFLG